MSRKKLLSIGLLTMLGLSARVALAQGPSVASFTVVPDTVKDGQQFVVTITFDMNMDTTGAYNPKLTMGRSAPYDAVDVPGTWTDKTIYEAAFTVTSVNPAEDGLYTFSVQHFRSEAGDTLATNPTIPAEKVLIDRSAPVTTHAFDNSPWYNQNIQITFTASDTADGTNGAGLSKIYYSVNDGDTTTIDVPASTVSQNFNVTITTEGSDNKVKYWAEDVLGQKEVTNTLSGIKLDKTAPSASVTNLDTLYRTTAFDVPVTASDNLSGVKWFKLYYMKKDVGVWTLYTSPTPSDSLFPANAPIPFVGEDNTVYYFEVVAVDSANNVEARAGAAEDSTRIDLVRPKLTGITFVHKDAITDTVCFGTVTIQLIFDTDMDATSVPVVTWGLNEPYTDFNIVTSASNWITPRIWQGVFTVTPDVPEAGKDGHYGFRVQGAKAQATGRLMEPTLTYYENTPVPYDVIDLRHKLLIDRGAPFVAHIPAFDINAWHQRIIFTVTAADTASPGLRGSGVKSITYTLNGTEVTTAFESPEIQRSTAPDTIDTEGSNNTLSYWAEDFCGNLGVGTREVRLTGIKIDRTPPSVNVISPTPTTSSNLVFDVYYDESSNTDNLSGVRHVELWYRKDRGAWTRYGGGAAVYNSSPISFNATATGEGEYQFEVVGVDSAGNRLRTGIPEWTTVISLPKPVVTKLVWIYENTEIDTVGIGAVTLQLQFDRSMDMNSIINVTYGLDPPYDSYNVSGQNTRWIDDRRWEGTFTVSQGVPDCDGLYVFRIQGAVDADGFEMAELFSFDPNGQFQRRLLIDRTPPVTTIRFDSTNYNAATGWWFGTDISARLIAQDIVTEPQDCAGAQGSGVVAFWLQVNNDPVTQKSLPAPTVIADTTFTISTEGRNNTVRFWAADALGLQESVDADNIITGIKLDKTPPQATASSIDSSSTLTFNVTWTGLDPAPNNGGGPATASLSGLSHIELWYRTDTNRQWTKFGDFTSSPISFTGEDNRVYEFEAVAVDSAGNKETRRGVAETSTVIGTPKPLLTRVSFIYKNTITDTVAKGLTVIELRFNTKMDVTIAPNISYGLQAPYNTYNIPHIGTQWITDRIFQATFTISDDVPAVDGRYGFRISGARAAPDGLNTAMETTFSSNVDGGRFLLVDRTAPGIPAEIAITPSGWSNADEVVLSWQNPDDLSGIAAVWYRLGTAPQSKRDGIQVEKKGATSLGISTIGMASGSYQVHVWLEDAAGNLDHQNRTMVTLKTDKVMPEFTAVSVPTTADVGQDLTFSGTVVEDIGLDLSVSKLYYRKGGDASDTAVDLVLRNGTVSATIPGSAVTSRGLTARAVIADSAGNAVNVPQWHVAVRTPGTVAAITQPAGSSASAYRLISIPLKLDNPDAVQVLKDDLGDPAGGKNWRLLEWDPATSSFKEYPNVGPFQPGKSFFLISRAQKKITPGAGESVRVDQPYKIALKKGWNLVAVPFDFSVNVSALSMKSGAAVGQLWGYTGSWKLATTLDPWKGYAIYASSSDTLLVAPTAAGAAPAKPSTVLAADGGGWNVQIIASKGDGRDEVNYFGVRDGAAPQADDLDLREPPFISDVTVYFSQEDQQGQPGIYATDFRPYADEGYVWNFTVRSNGSGIVELEFPEISSIPIDREVYLIDAEAKLARDLRKNSRYSYLVGDNTRERKLTVVVGSKQFVEENNLGVPLSPTRYELFQNYPNPFNPETTIRYSLPKRATVTLEIYNLLGQRVRTLVDHQSQDADFYVVHWDGRNEAGAPVASGVYITYLRAGSFVASRKMILMK
jgi:hypothetical protein